MIALFMAGGSGTRLWPLSREDNPKQLHALVGDKSLMTQTVERVHPLVAAKDVWIVTSARYGEQIAAHAHGVPRAQIIAEPFPLGTNLAVGLGAMAISREHRDAVMLVGWADSHIENDEEFRTALALAAEVARETDGVILGVKPTFPATGYGYLRQGAPVAGYEGAYEIAAFAEKPSADVAQTFYRSDDYLWNPGISIWKVSTLLDLMRRFKPAHHAALEQVAPFLGTPVEAKAMDEAFRDLDREAIDTAIFEKAERLATIPVELGWSDIGSWSALHDVLAPTGDADGNVTRGPVVAVETKGSLIFGRDKLIATLGINDLVIVDAGDAILIARKQDAERLKELHQKIKAEGLTNYL